MRIIIIGSGEVGRFLSEAISDARHNVTVVEQEEAKARRVDEELNARVVHGNGASAQVLLKAGVRECDVVLAMTADDRTNLLACSLAKGLHPQTTTIARIHDQTYIDSDVFNYQAHFRVDHLINPEALSAVELAKAIRNPGRVAVESFARGQIEVQQCRVGARSRLAGRSLKELKLDPRVRLGYVQRQKEVEVARASTVLRENDVATLFGESEPLFALKAKLDPGSESETRRVVLFGGTETSIALARLLTNPRFRIRIIERDHDVCLSIAERIPQTTVIHGDATSLRLMQEERIGAAAYFVAASRQDEENMMTCLQANQLGAEHVMMVLNKPDYGDLLESYKEALGIEQVVSPREATAKEVLRYLSPERHHNLGFLPKGAGRIMEVKVGKRCAKEERPLRDVPLPDDVVLVALLHKFRARVPAAEDMLRVGDRVVVVTPENQVERVLEVLS